MNPNVESGGRRGGAFLRGQETGQLSCKDEIQNQFCAEDLGQSLVEYQSKTYITLHVVRSRPRNETKEQARVG